MADKKLAVTRLHDAALVDDIANWIRKYVVFTDDYAFPIALWVIATYMYQQFDAFPYMVVTAATKRSGKTRLGVELMSFVANKPKPFGAMTAASMFHIVDEQHPTVLFDESEGLGSEAAGAMRSVLNVGYRRGSKVPRVVGNETVEYDTYCPKVFILIGDVYDTLRDRSIIIRMRRADSPMRMLYSVAEAEGAKLRERIKAAVAVHVNDVVDAYMSPERLEFLNDRDEEIWSPLFAMARVFTPGRAESLKRIAVDMATEKTVDASSYVKSKAAETQAQQDEYAALLLHDMAAVMGGKNMSSVELSGKLRELVTSPWRKFGGDGITPDTISDIIRPFAVKPVPIRVGKGKSGSNANVVKGYKYADVKAAIDKHNPKK